MDFTRIRLEGLDVYRDGGSISASFLNAEGISNTLFFKINIRATEPDGPPKYFPPVLKTLKMLKRTSPVTAVTTPYWQEEERASSWLEARRILDALEPQVEGFVSNYRWVFAVMQEVAASEGPVSPSTIERLAHRHRPNQ
jgi:hypothetical protein